MSSATKEIITSKGETSSVSTAKEELTTPAKGQTSTASVQSSGSTTKGEATTPAKEHMSTVPAQSSKSTVRGELTTPAKGTASTLSVPSSGSTTKVELTTPVTGNLSSVSTLSSGSTTMESKVTTLAKGQPSTITVSPSKFTVSEEQTTASKGQTASLPVSVRGVTPDEKLEQSTPGKGRVSTIFVPTNQGTPSIVGLTTPAKGKPSTVYIPTPRVTVNEEMTTAPTSDFWSLWTSWSDCSVKCGEGVQRRNRTCIYVSETKDVRGCHGKNLELKYCTRKECVCIFTADTFRKEFGYDDFNPFGWIEKDGKPGKTSEEEVVYFNDKIEQGVIVNIDCNNCTCAKGEITCTKTRCKETGCKYGEWTDWSTCSKTCDNGIKKRHRIKSFHTGSEPCTEATEEIVNCNIVVCNNEWVPWSPWSGCSTNVACMSGKQIRARECVTENGQLPSSGCVGSKLQSKICENDCPETPECSDGKVWTECKKNNRNCPVTCADVRLPNSCVETEECEPGCRCPEGQVEYNNECVNASSCPCFDEDGNIRLPGFEVPTSNVCQKCICQENGMIECTKREQCCALLPWSSWSVCHTSCGKGIRKRFRTIDEKISSGCNSTNVTEEADCFVTDCIPECRVNDKNYRNDEVINTTECETCHCQNNKARCSKIPLSIVDGNWTEWSEWSECSSTCSNGIRMRERTCSNPLPKCSGALCEGENTQQESCNEEVPCCTVLSWSNWTECSKSCDASQKVRTRELLPEWSFSDCSIELKQTKKCNTDKCISGCNITQWSPWSPCSVTCGLGRKVRERTIIENLKEDCPTNLMDTEECNEMDCDCEENEIWKEEYCEHSCSDMFGKPTCKVNSCTCKDNFYRAMNGSCVAESKCKVCFVNDEPKQPKDIWINPEDNCELCECVSGKTLCHRVCEIKTCLPDEELSYDVPNQCCPRCVKKQSRCTLKSKMEFLFNPLAECKSVKKIMYLYCEGNCGLSSQLPVLMNANEGPGTHKNCTCCQGKPSEPIPVQMVCGSNEVEHTGFYVNMMSCKCQECSEI
ncbi:SCO-spondin [Octopus bimaculoides]|uniref:SCO-spondin n=1 Tax=Octopus bimaculoides TaxID=37653 RepID=UPI00071D654F|nr:SCO-spondin [Octopus bimaculoides]|eukprot:XP_014769815.1 PREDICTED: SCO-spondin-like [Octopus bimaculoides]